MALSSLPQVALREPSSLICQIRMHYCPICSPDSWAQVALTLPHGTVHTKRMTGILQVRGISSLIQCAIPISKTLPSAYQIENFQNAALQEQSCQMSLAERQH